MAPPMLALELLLMIADYIIDADQDEDRKRYLHDVQSLRQVNRVLYVYLNPIFWQKTLSDKGVNKWVVSPRVFKPLIETNDLLRLKFFLDCGADVECFLDWRDADGVPTNSSPLKMACSLDNVPIARLLLESCEKNAISPRITNSVSIALHAARSAEMVHLLMDFDADPKYRNGFGENPLHRYAEHGHTGAMRAILQRGALVDSISNSFECKWTPLHKAAQHRSEGPVKILLEFGADVRMRDIELNTPLHWAVKNGGTEVMRLLLECWPDAVREKNDRLNTPLHLAAGVELAGPLHQPMIWSPRPSRGDPVRAEVVKLLVESWPKGVRERNQDWDTPLHLAAGARRTPWLRWNTWPCGDPVRAEVVGLLMASWPEGVREKNKSLNTPLHLAVVAKEIEVVKLLVARWPEGVQERNAKFQTPLHLAVESDLKDVVELLAKYWPEGTRAVEEEAKIEREKIEAKRAMSGRRWEWEW